MATLVPELTKRSVMARPNPCAPPVTTAQRPFRSILFMVIFLALKRPAAVDDVGDAGRECALVAGEVDRERGDFIGGAEPSHRLPAHEHFAAPGASGLGAIQHRGRLDGPGADANTSDATGDEKGRDREGKRH